MGYYVGSVPAVGGGHPVGLESDLGDVRVTVGVGRGWGGGGRGREGPGPVRRHECRGRLWGHDPAVQTRGPTPKRVDGALPGDFNGVCNFGTRK